MLLRIVPAGSVVNALVTVVLSTCGLSGSPRCSAPRTLAGAASHYGLEGHRSSVVSDGGVLTFGVGSGGGEAVITLWWSPRFAGCC
jgi:hypothetical protein